MQAWFETQQHPREIGMSTNTGRYFCLKDDTRIPGRWHVKSPVDDKGERFMPWQLMKGESIKFSEPWSLDLMRQGNELGFSLTGMHVAAVSRQFVDLFGRLGIQHEVQFIPARVNGRSEPCFVLNPLHVVKCIDEARCEEIEFREPDPSEPELADQYKYVYGLRIDPAAVGNVNIFRPARWQIEIIVSERVKLAMEEEDLVGPVFTEV